MKQLRQRTKINFLKEEPSKEAIEKVKEIDKEICQALKKTETLRYRKEILGSDGTSAHGNQQNVDTSSILVRR